MLPLQQARTHEDQLYKLEDEKQGSWQASMKTTQEESFSCLMGWFRLILRWRRIKGWTIQKSQHVLHGIWWFCNSPHFTFEELQIAFQNMYESSIKLHAKNKVLKYENTILKQKNIVLSKEVSELKIKSNDLLSEISIANDKSKSMLVEISYLKRKT